MLTNLSFTGMEVLLGLVSLAVVVLGAIAVGKYRLAHLSVQSLKAAHLNDTTAYDIGSRTKYPEADVFRNSSLFFKLGLAVVLGFLVLAFNWTQFEEKVNIPEGAMEMEYDIAMDAPPQTNDPPPPAATATVHHRGSPQ